MSLKDQDEIDAILKHIQFNEPIIDHNKDLFRIYEGDLKSFIEAELQRQLSDKSFNLAKFRIAPINVLIQIVDKLSKIYAKPPTRTVEDGTSNESMTWTAKHECHRSTLTDGTTSFEVRCSNGSLEKREQVLEQLLEKINKGDSPAPIPWSHANATIYDSDGVVVADCDRGDNQANIALIVEACNNYEKLRKRLAVLLEATQLGLDWLNYVSDQTHRRLRGDGIGWYDSKVKIKEAIASARKEPNQ